MNAGKKILFIYLAGFLFAVHYATIAYVNSSLLQQFVKNSTLNILYIAGSVLGIVLLFLAPFFLRKYGSVPSFLFFVFLEILAVFGMGSASAALLVVLLFLIHHAGESMLYFFLDVNMEQETKAEGTTGRKRGVFLTVQNIAWILSPLVFGILASAGNFSRTYLFSGIVLLPLFFIVLMFFRNIKKASSQGLSIISALLSLKRGKDGARIIGAQFVLQFFFAWMVIYLPLLLSKEMGFGWDKIGTMFTIMLLPFLLFELPAGFLSDKKIGEKELLIIGFIIMSLATFAVPFIHSPVFWIWAALLFVTRVGASLVEVSSESYFFKRVKESDTGLISLFRITRPLSYIVAPLFALPVIFFFSYSTSFLFLAIFTLSGLLFIPKVDTR